MVRALHHAVSRLPARPASRGRVVPYLLALGVVSLVGPGVAREGLLTPALAAPPKKVADAPYPPEFQARVRQAIGKGVEYLRTGQIVDRPEGVPAPEDRDSLRGPDYEEAAAVTWVLRRAGLPADDPVFVRAGKVIRARAVESVDEAALLLLALCTPALAEGNPFAIEERVEARAGSQAIAASDRPLVDGAVRSLLGRQLRSTRTGTLDADQHGGWGMGWGTQIPGAPLPLADVPSTYLALLGLEAAARCGVEVPAATYLDALRFLLRCQPEKGPRVTLSRDEVHGRERFQWTEKAQARGMAWTPGLEESTCGYHTAGGAAALVICQDALGKGRSFPRDLRKQCEAAIRDALAWLQQNYAIDRNPVVEGGFKEVQDLTSDLFRHHWLQGLARLAIHLRMRQVGDHDWYQEGAEHLLATQQPDGSWEAIWWSNCYSLLFLMRASLTTLAPVVTPSEQDPGR